MTIINVDNDKSRWSFTTEIGGGNAFYSNKDWDNPGDDYLITPPLWIEDTSVKYNIEFEVKYDSPVKPEEYFDVWRGSEPTLDGIREKRIAPKTKITSRAYYKVNYDFDIPSVRDSLHRNPLRGRWSRPTRNLRAQHQHHQDRQALCRGRNLCRRRNRGSGNRRCHTHLRLRRQSRNLRRRRPPCRIAAGERLGHGLRAFRHLHRKGCQARLSRCT